MLEMISVQITTKDRTTILLDRCDIFIVSDGLRRRQYKNTTENEE